MRPIAAIALIILCSSLAITVSLSAVIIIVLVLGEEYPLLQHEFGDFLSSLLLFVVMTIISAPSFFAVTKNHSAWLPAQTTMWLGVCAVGWYFCP